MNVMINKLVTVRRFSQFCWGDGQTLQSVVLQRPKIHIPGGFCRRKNGRDREIGVKNYEGTELQEESSLVPGQRILPTGTCRKGASKTFGR